MKKLLAIIMFLVAWASAADVYFDSRFTLWKDATILIWTLLRKTHNSSYRIQPLS